MRYSNKANLLFRDNLSPPKTVLKQTFEEMGLNAALVCFRVDIFVLVKQTFYDDFLVRLFVANSFISESHFPSDKCGINHSKCD